MPLQAVLPLRLYRQIAGQIQDLIERGEFKAGSRLPAERELAAQLGVSRTSVREAIISLEIAGFVEVRVGTGIFVRQPPRPGAGPAEGASDRGPGPFDLLSARAMIEGEIAAVAARNRRKSDVQRLRATIERMRAHADDEDFGERDAADREFHEHLAAMTGNSALVWIVGSMWDQRRSDLWRRTEAHFHTPELRAKTLLDHEAIVAALQAGDADAAREAMRHHLSRVAREFRRRIEAESAGASRSRARPAHPSTHRRSAARRAA